MRDVARKVVYVCVEGGRAPQIAEVGIVGFGSGLRVIVGERSGYVQTFAPFTSVFQGRNTLG